MNYSPYVSIEGVGGWVGVSTCLRCGSCILLSENIDSIKLHDDWHENYAQVAENSYYAGMLRPLK